MSLHHSCHYVPVNACAHEELLEESASIASGIASHPVPSFLHMFLFASTVNLLLSTVINLVMLQPIF